MRPCKGLTNLPPPSIAVLPHNLGKKSPSGFICHHLQRGYHILFLQELNEMPSLPHLLSYGNTKGKIFTNINKRKKTTTTQGTRDLALSTLLTPPPP